MTRIFKYQVAGDGFDEWEVEMPVGAKILSAGIQYNKLMVWAIVNVDAPMEKRTIGFYGTGSKLPDDFTKDHRHISTVFEGGFVWHIFEIVKVETMVMD